VLAPVPALAAGPGSETPERAGWGGRDAGRASGIPQGTSSAPPQLAEGGGVYCILGGECTSDLYMVSLGLLLFVQTAREAWCCWQHGVFKLGYQFVLKSPGDCTLRYNKHQPVQGPQQGFSLRAGQARLLCRIPVSVTELPFPLLPSNRWISPKPSVVSNYS